MRTTHLQLAPHTLEQIRAMVEAMSPADKLELSPDWLAKLRVATTSDPWIHGFALILLENNVSIGSAGFKGPPDAAGVVEIAYGIEPDYQGKGYATEAVQAITAHAFSSGKVRLVRAHTHPESGASMRVLTKCGFQRIGEVVDPEDGLVVCWEKSSSADRHP